MVFSHPGPERYSDVGQDFLSPTPVWVGEVVEFFDHFPDPEPVDQRRMIGKDKINRR